MTAGAAHAGIHLAGIWKSYPRWPARDATVRGMLAGRFRLLGRGSERRWALQDAHLDAAPGESVGVIGLNGAGKSTLLRLAAGLGRADRGRIEVPANTAAVLSFESWFDLNLTGRENATTALVINGWRRAEARELLPAVLEFAELEGIADAPMRTYSEGQKLRIAFGVVAQLEPAALLVDEVLAVGDIRFERKCLDRIRAMREHGACVVLASHDLDRVLEECDRAVWLQAGAVRASGAAESVVEEYREAMRSATVERTPPPSAGEAGALALRENRFGSQEVTIDSVTLSAGDGSITDEVPSGGSLTVSLRLSTRDGAVDDPIVGVAIHRARDGVVCYESHTAADGVGLGSLHGELTVRLFFERLDLMPGEYVLDAGVYRPDWEYAYDFHWHAYPLRITGVSPDRGVLRPPHRWQVARPEP